MRPELIADAANQGGLFTRRQAVAAGYTERELKTLTGARGRWVVVRRGVYVEGSQLDSLNADERWRLRDLAAHLTTSVPHVMSHDSAARLWRLPMLTVDSPLSHITRPGVGGSRTEGGVSHHLDRSPLCVDDVDGVLVTGLARTAVDVARLHGYTHGLVSIDAARQLGVALADLQAEVARMRNYPRVTGARAAVADSDAGAESPGETLARILVRELGFTDVETQFAVRGPQGQPHWVDLRVGLHLIEFDGRIKLRSVTDGGVATKNAEQVVWDEKVRQRHICSQGFGMSRIIWSDCFGRARERAKQRIRAEYAVTEARFGRQLPPDLRAYADAHPRRAPRLAA